MELPKKMELPRFVVLKSSFNGKFLRHIPSDDGGDLRGFLQFSGDEVVSPSVKLQVEMATSRPGLVHLRSCYNNKYWVRRSANENWIVGGAEQPQEDISKWSCTLFKPVFVNADDKTVQFLHVQLGYYVSLSSAGPSFTDYLFAESNTEDDKSMCTFIDWESLVILPEYVAFKDCNDKYLTTKYHYFLKFDSTDIREKGVVNQIFTNEDGNICIKSSDLDRFWVSHPKWKHSPVSFINLSEKGHDKFMWFKPVKVDKNVIALRCVGTGKYCSSNTKRYLVSHSPTICREAYLKVQEPVISRKIYNVNFRLTDARIYNQAVLVMASGDALNLTEQPNEAEVNLSYTQSESTTWKSSVSVTLGFDVKIDTKTPFIVGNEIKFSTKIERSYEWGKTEESTSQLQTVYRVIVPAKSKVKISLVATKGSCDVPFSYTQRDELTNGQVITRPMDDGMCTGANSFNFKYEIKQEKM